MKKRTAWVVAAAVAALALGAAAVGLVALVVRGGAPSMAWPAGAQYLAIEVGGDLAEEPARGLTGLLESHPPSLRALTEAIDRAARDEKVKGLLLRVGSLEVGWARLAELRDALIRFQRSGKPSWAHLEQAGNQEYYLATGCRKIAASPTALLDISGLAAEVTFYKGTLDKLGIEAQFEGIGKYKNAPNQFTERGFTAPHREQMEALVGSLFDSYVKAISDARSLELDAVRRLVDDGPFDSARAKAAGLVDELLYRDEVEARIGAHHPIGARRYVKSSRGFGFGSKPEIALVYAVGTIVPGESGSTGFMGDLAGADTIVRGLREAVSRSSVRAVILRVDSPGGSGTASDAVWREMGLARQKKPVIVSMGDYAASGGYYISMSSDAIVAEPGTITGSIGVFSGKFSLAGLYRKIGISEGAVVRGRHARLFSSSEPWNQEERQRVRELNRSFYTAFVSKAAEGRRRTEAEIESVAQGRVWTGAEALAAGLVDRLGGLDVAVALAREKGGIAKGQEAQLVVVPEPKGFLELLMERQDDDVATRLVGARTARAAGVLRWARQLAEGGPIVRMPFDVSVR
jgi:protease-4